VVQKTLIDGRVYFDRQRDKSPTALCAKKREEGIARQNKRRPQRKKPESGDAAKKPGEKEARRERKRTNLSRRNPRWSLAVRDEERSLD